MVDVFTSSTTDNWGTDRIQTAFDLKMAWFLQDKPMFRDYARKYTPAKIPHASDTFTVTVGGQLPENTTPLDEESDIDAVAMPDVRQVSVTVDEYGSAVNATQRLILTSFTASDLKDISFVLGDNGVRSVDRLYQNALDGSTYSFFVDDDGTTLTRVDPGVDGCGPFRAQAGVAAVTQLRNRNVVPTDGTSYLAVVHPNIAADIRTEADSAWVAAHTYRDTKELYKGETGEFAGGRYVENTRCTNAVPGGETERRYTSYFLGDEALLHTVLRPLGLIVGPQTDKARRFHPVSWYTFFGVTRFRENAIERVISTSSFGGLDVVYDPKA